MSEYAIQLENIEKSFGGVPVLKKVNFNLKKGAIHALVGGNGAGKSTLMKILTGVYFCDGGTIKIDGKPVVINNYNDARKHGISLIFQELSLVPTLTVAENIFLNKEMKKGIVRDKKAMAARTEQLLAELGIDIDCNAKIKDLDVGYCQLIEIAKALSEEANVLVMDEPTASLTEKETEILFNIIAGLKEKGVSIVYISHRMNEIFRIADEIAVLRDGNIVADMPTGDYTMQSLIDHMIGETTEKKMAWQDRLTPVGSEVMLEVKNLNLGTRLKDISFKLYKGEVLGLAGLMGSGRTEIVESIFGERKPDSGEIILKGKKVRIKNVGDAISDGIALVPEDRRRQGLVLTHTVRENLITPNLKRVSRHAVLDQKLINSMCEQSIEDLNIKTDGMNVEMLSLSGGNQQKVVIAKWLNTQPDVMLMDEPTAGVDVGAKAEIIDIIRKLAEQGKSIIFVSSELAEMMAVCDRVLIFKDGRQTGEFTHAELDTEEVLQHAIQN